MVLAIGLVVDDAIIILENIHRHIEQGMNTLDASLQGARELAWPIIAMTTTLVSVYLPIGFMGGLTGRLFLEFAFSLAGAVLLSGVIALTLSPVMCSVLLRDTNTENKFEKILEQGFLTVKTTYQKYLEQALINKELVLVFALIILSACYFLFITSPKELEPPEDQGIILVSAEADPAATLNYLETNTQEFTKIATTIPEVQGVFLVNGVSGTNTAFAGFVLKSFTERKRTTQQVQKELQTKINQIPGLQSAVFVPPSLPTAGHGLPVEFLIGSTDPIENIQEVVESIVVEARKSNKFIFLDQDIKINQPSYIINIDRKKAASMGVSMQDLGRELAFMLSGVTVNRFPLQNRAYKVIVQVQQNYRFTPENIKNYYMKLNNGMLVPISMFIDFQLSVKPNKLQRFQQLNSIMISGIPRPGVTIGEAITVLEKTAASRLPEGYTQDYSGQARQYKQEGNTLLITFFCAFIVIYLVLAAQFESFIDPCIMLITVPMSICGAMFFISLGFTSLNIYSQVGLITLIGVISKHGILIVEFANNLQQTGLTKIQAITDAASIRLRPVLMTTLALVLAMVPLLISSGPGSGSRFAIGIIIASGMTIGTIFTMFVLPVFYLYLGRTVNIEK